MTSSPVVKRPQTLEDLRYILQQEFGRYEVSLPDITLKTTPQITYNFDSGIELVLRFYERNISLSGLKHVVAKAQVGELERGLRNSLLEEYRVMQLPTLKAEKDYIRREAVIKERGEEGFKSPKEEILNVARSVRDAYEEIRS